MASTINFEMTGKMSLPKESDKFHPYQDTTYDSGWERKQLMFNMTCGDNSHLLTVQAGAYADGHGDVHSFTKGSVKEDGTKVKGELVKIPFKERLTTKLLPEIAEFRKFIFDLETPGRRYKLEHMIDKIKEGTSITDEELKEVGLENESEVSEAYDKSLKKRHEYISEWDFVDFIKKVLDSDKYKDKKFHVRGNVDCSYSDTKQTVYKNLVPNRIYLAADDADEHSTATINLLFGNESLDDMSVEEKGKYYVNGWVMAYDSNRRADIPVPTTVVIPNANSEDEHEKKKADAIAKKFRVDGETIYNYGFEVNILNGSQRKTITLDDLNDEQREDVELGIQTLEDITKEMGGSVYGDRISEWQFLKPARGFSKGKEETVYTADDMVIKPLESDEVEDLFEEDEDEL